MKQSALRLALVAPLVAPLTEPFLGGSQAVLFDLATGLARCGHQVTVFGADGSHVPGTEVVRLGIDSRTLRPTSFAAPGPLDEALAERERASFLRIAYEVRRRAADFHLVHNHAFDAPAFELLQEAHPHIVHTLHLPPSVAAVTAAARAAARTGAVVVMVSHSSASSWEPHVGAQRVVYNGVPVDRIPTGSARRRGWLYVGRISPEKGLQDALNAAEGGGERLRVVGAVYDVAYHQRVRDQLARHEVLGQLPRADVFMQMARAQGVLMPVRWDEPFGMTAAEAMAAGTPVAAYRRGAMAELIADGRTGFLVTAGDVEALTAAARRFSTIDPAPCRQWVSERFSAAKMIAAYQALYREVL